MELRRSLGLADKVRRVIGAAGPLVRRHLRIRTEWTAHIHAVVGDVICRDLTGRIAVFTPAFDGVDHRKLVRAGPSATVIHSGHHEQAKPIVLLRSHSGKDAGVVVDGVERRDRSAGPTIIPTVIDQKLAAVRLEGPKIRVGDFDVARLLDRERRIAF